MPRPLARLPPTTPRNLRAVLFCLLAYGLVLYTCFKAVFYANGWSQKYGASSNTARRNQYSTSERNTQKYHSMRFVWPETLKSGDDTPPTIFCVIPHGVLPTGILAYPVFSKLFSPRLCRWTAAPIIFKVGEKERERDVRERCVRERCAM